MFQKKSHKCDVFPQFGYFHRSKSFTSWGSGDTPKLIISLQKWIFLHRIKYDYTSSIQQIVQFIICSFEQKNQMTNSDHFTSPCHTIMYYKTNTAVCKGHLHWKYCVTSLLIIAGCSLCSQILKHHFSSPSTNSSSSTNSNPSTKIKASSKH